MPDRSTGVQQGHEEQRLPPTEQDVMEALKRRGVPYNPARAALEAVRPFLREAVSPEPREGEQEKRSRRNALRIDLADFLRAVTRQYDETAVQLADEWLASARYDYRDVAEPYLPALRGPEPKVEADNPAHKLRNRPDSDAIEQSHGDATNDPSVASVLRRTASRLRDPGYHWYEHAAVTLERLAEKLEKGRDG